MFRFYFSYVSFFLVVTLLVVAGGCSFGRRQLSDLILSGVITDDSIDYIDFDDDGRVTQREQTMPRAATLPKDDDIVVKPFADVSPDEVELYRLALSQCVWGRNLFVGSSAGRIDKERLITALQRQPTSNYERLNGLKGTKTLGSNTDKFSDSILSQYRWYSQSFDLIEKTLVKELAFAATENIVDTEAKRLPANIIAPVIALTNDEKSLVRLNAAILLARIISNDDVKLIASNFIDESAIAGLLVKDLSDKKLTIEVRCAAVESLGRLTNVKTPQFVSLLKIAAPKQAGNQTDNGIPLLYAEMLCALSSRIPPYENDAFKTALKSLSKEVRIEAVAAWRRYAPSADSNDSTVELPPELFELLEKEQNADVYGAVLLTLAEWQHPDAIRFLRASLDDQYVPVKLAAIEALGVYGGNDAKKLLCETLHNTSPRLRARAVRALRVMKCYDVIFQTNIVEDKSQEVRSEVAAALADSQTSETLAILRRYWNDVSAAVVRTAVTSSNAWELEVAAPMLFEMMSRQSFPQRVLASETLAKRWQHGGDTAFDPKDTPENRELTLQLLVELFERENEKLAIGKYGSNGVKSRNDTVNDILSGGTTDTFDDIEPVSFVRHFDNITNDVIVKDVRRLLDVITSADSSREQQQAVAALVSVNDLVGVLETIQRDERDFALPRQVYEDILPKVEPIFETLQFLESNSLQQRRRAAVALQESRGKLGSLATQRLLDISLRENDAMILGITLDVLSRNNERAVKRLAVKCCQHPSDDVRRNAYRRLGGFDDAVTMKWLVYGLNDKNLDVVQTAIEGLQGKTLEKVDDNEFVAELQRLERSQSQVIQLNVALLLVKLGDKNARETIERISMSNDNSVRQYAAKSLARCNDTEYLPELIRFLDDNSSINRIALEALPKITGRDMGAALPDGDNSTQAKVLRWKKWWGTYKNPR
ncbi:MAG: HEAT repeat domain-containing protein [Planctomycetaceae bacterium]|nr:HEAT repeat domain-containing protein [Planctomycetaceae bacterium]